MKNDAEQKLADLTARLMELAHGGRFALAFSGGLDSRFLAHTAKRAGLRPLLLYAEGPHIAAADSHFARRWASAHEMDFRSLAIDLLIVPEVARNDRMRCYHCKKALLSRLLDEAGSLCLCDGTQASDMGAYRPGIAALQELGIVSPLAVAGLSKAEIRLLGAMTALDFPEQRARPCLLTRFAYQVQPDQVALAALDKAEEAIGNILRTFSESNGNGESLDFRLRCLSRDVLELHLAPLSASGEDCDSLPPSLAVSLEEAVAQEFGIAPAAIRILPSLSGFFDKA